MDSIFKSKLTPPIEAPISSTELREERFDFRPQQEEVQHLETKARFVGNWFRKKRTRHLKSLIREIHSEKNRVSILDIGGTFHFWQLFSDSFLNKYNIQITITNVIPMSGQPDHPRIHHFQADGCNLGSVSDGAFDIAHSNSVIEHVGNWEKKVQFAKEISRVGQAYVVQSPNFWFPIDPHFYTPLIHWIPKPCRIWLLRNVPLGNWGRVSDLSQAILAIEDADLLTKKMMEFLFQDGQIKTERFLGYPKSYIAIRQAVQPSKTSDEAYFDTFPKIDH